MQFTEFFFTSASSFSSLCTELFKLYFSQCTGSDSKNSFGIYGNNVLVKASELDQSCDASNKVRQHFSVYFLKTLIHCFRKSDCFSTCKTNKNNKIAGNSDTSLTLHAKVFH